MKHYEFEVVLSGYGETPEEAWDQAIEGFSMEPGTFEQEDILSITEVDEDTYNEIEVTFIKPDVKVDLLEACKFTLLCIDENWNDLSNARVMLEQAIAKAEGK